MFSRHCFIVFSFLIFPCLSRAENSFSQEDAKHLLMRSGFAPTISELAKFEGMSKAQAVTQLLQKTDQPTVTPRPPASQRYERVFRPSMSAEDRRDANRKQAAQLDELRAWWLEEMRQTQSPLRERMVLFWHNHFTSGFDKVRSSTLLAEQNELFRQHAIGKFDTLLRAVVLHPTMLLYLDQVQSTKSKPNENLARELLELFTLGEGNYSEADIKEVARALTGLGWDAETGQVRRRPALHDDGTKTILGQSKRFNAEQVLALLAAHPKTAEWVSRKLLREFLTPKPSEEQVQALAKVWQASGGDLKQVLFALFTSDDFYAQEHRAHMVKSPVELVVGTMRQLGLQVEGYQAAVVLTRNMGQNLFAPPNVKGWPGHLVWLNSGSLLLRKNTMARFIQNDGQELSDNADAQTMQMMNAKMDARERRTFAGSIQFDAPKYLASVATLNPKQWESALLAAPAVQVEVDAVSHTALRQIVLDPSYQLK